MVNNEIICPYCFEKTVRKTGPCARCGEYLNRQLTEANLGFFAIVGSRGCGKSHYFTMLIRELRLQSDRFGWKISPINDETEEMYDRRFYKPLFERGVAIEQTKQNDPVAKRPLIYLLETTFAGQMKKALLVFYDGSGEYFRSDKDIANSVRYLANSVGVIFLVDPLRFSRVRAMYLARFPGEQANLPEELDNTVSPASIIRRLATALGERLRGAQNAVPMAVAISKIDALKFWLTDEAPVFFPPFHDGGLSRTDCLRVSEYCSNVFRAMDSNNDFVTLTRRFKPLGYFGVSALGQNPEATQRLEFEPRPIRVLDPLLWLFYHTKLIPLVDDRPAH